MKKTAKKTAPNRKISIKDLKAKGAGSVKGGGSTVTGGFDISKRH